MNNSTHKFMFNAWKCLLEEEEERAEDRESTWLEEVSCLTVTRTLSISLFLSHSGFCPVQHSVKFLSLSLSVHRSTAPQTSSFSPTWRPLPFPLHLHKLVSSQCPPGSSHFRPVWTAVSLSSVLLYHSMIISPKI